MTTATNIPPDRLARIAGALYLVQMAAGVGGYMIRASVAGRDASQTAQNIVSAGWFYRLSIVADVGMVCAVIVLTWALYLLLAPVNKAVALLATCFRLVENALLLTVTVSFLVALTVLQNPAYQQTFDATQLHALSRLARSAQAHGYTLGFVLLGVGSGLFAYLLLMSRHVPRVLAAWGLGASALMTVCSCGIILFPAATPVLQMLSFGPMGIYEVGVGAWLLLRGPRSS